MGPNFGHAMESQSPLEALERRGPRFDNHFEYDDELSNRELKESGGDRKFLRKLSNNLKLVRLPWPMVLKF